MKKQTQNFWHWAIKEKRIQNMLEKPVFGEKMLQEHSEDKSKITEVIISVARSMLELFTFIRLEHTQLSLSNILGLLKICVLLCKLNS